MNRKPTNAELLGFLGDGNVTIPERSWHAMRRIVARMMISWTHVGREAEQILEGCKHADGCEAARDRAMPCRAECPDRERWLSALVCLANAEQFSGQVAVPKRAATGGSYIPPTREYFDRVVAELEALRAVADLAGPEAAGAFAGASLRKDLEGLGLPAEKATNRLIDVGEELERDLSEEEQPQEDSDDAP